MSWVQIHWFSIINSCVTVLLLTGFLATILMRVLKNDFIKYTRDDEAGGTPTHTPWRAMSLSYRHMQHTLWGIGGAMISVISGTLWRLYCTVMVGYVAERAAHTAD